MLLDNLFTKFNLLEGNGIAEVLCCQVTVEIPIVDTTFNSSAGG